MSQGCSPLSSQLSCLTMGPLETTVAKATAPKPLPMPTQPPPSDLLSGAHPASNLSLAPRCPLRVPPSHLLPIVQIPSALCPKLCSCPQLPCCLGLEALEGLAAGPLGLQPVSKWSSEMRGLALGDNTDGFKLRSIWPQTLSCLRILEPPPSKHSQDEATRQW